MIPLYNPLLSLKQKSAKGMKKGVRRTLKEDVMADKA